MENFNPHAAVMKEFKKVTDFLIDIKHDSLPEIKAKINEKKEIIHNEEGYVDKKEAARLLDCSVALIDKLRRNGKLPRYTIDGIVRFKKSDVLEIPKLKEQATAEDYRTNLHNKKRA